MDSIINKCKDKRLGLTACLIVLASLGCGSRDDCCSSTHQTIEARRNFVGTWMATVSGSDSVMLLSSLGQARMDPGFSILCGIGAWTVRSPEEIVVVLTVPCGQRYAWTEADAVLHLIKRNDGTLENPNTVGHELSRIWERVDSTDPGLSAFTYREE